MTVAIDIDGTWSAGPSLFAMIYDIFISHGWDVIIVTGAYQTNEKLDKLGIPQDAVIVYAINCLKSEAVRLHGYNVSVWIDNEPGTIEPCRILQDNKDSEL